MLRSTPDDLTQMSYNFFIMIEQNSDWLIVYFVGAIVGGPNSNDGFSDLRNHSEYSEPTTYINAIFIGVHAKFS